MCVHTHLINDAFSASKELSIAPRIISRIVLVDHIDQSVL